MQTKKIYICAALLIFFKLSSYGYALTSGDREWWKNHYKDRIITSDKNQFVKRANKLFYKMLATAGYPDNKSPELIVIKKQNKPWALALEDGAVVLSEYALNLCYNGKKKEAGDALLAFVLGHEIAHIKNKDLWHLAAFKTIEDSGLDKETKEALSNTFNEEPDERKQKEIQADSDGFLFLIMAGFDAKYLFENNFFEEWVAQMPKQDFYCQPIQKFWSYFNKALGFHERSHKYPTLKQRAGYLQEYFKSISDNLYKFHFGVKLYELGKYNDALNLLEQFQKMFYSREVQNNIGILYYREALNILAEYDFCKAYKYKLANIIDYKTRAKQSYVKRGREEFNRRFDEAIRKLKKAYEKEPEYLPAIVNYSSALILKDNYIGAKLKINEAITICSNNQIYGYTQTNLDNNQSASLYYKPYIKMNNAIITYELEGYNKAVNLFKDLMYKYPGFPDLFYNYGRILFEENNKCLEKNDFKEDGKCKQVAELWDTYLELEKNGVYADNIRQIRNLPEWQPCSYTQGFIENPTINIGESSFKAKKELSDFYNKEHKTGKYYYKDNKHIIVIKNKVTLETHELKPQERINISKIYSRYGKPSRKIKHNEIKTLIYKNFAVDVDCNDMVKVIIYF